MPSPFLGSPAALTADSFPVPTPITGPIHAASPSHRATPASGLPPAFLAIKCPGSVQPRQTARQSRRAREWGWQTMRRKVTNENAEGSSIMLSPSGRRTGQDEARLGLPALPLLRSKVKRRSLQKNNRRENIQARTADRVLGQTRPRHSPGASLSKTLRWDCFNQNGAASAT